MWKNIRRVLLLEREHVNISKLIRRSRSTIPNLDLPVGSNEEPDNTQLAQINNRVPDALHQRFVYPEFLPDPKIEFRNHIRERLERMDMMKRRSQIELPEFYVGSILAVTRSTQHAASKQSRFLGICINRKGCGLRATFVLRNVIDNLGTEIMYYLYDPTILRIDVIKLEKRLDDELYYLRDALPEFSTFPEDMEPELLPEGAPVPINTTKVIMKPRPWYARWERTKFQGIDRSSIDSQISEKMKLQIAQHETPWEKYDLMKEYRRTIPEEEQKEIFAEVDSELHKMELARKKQKRKRTFVKPKKVA